MDIAPWVLETGLAFPTDDPRHSGQFSAWTGGYKEADDSLYQSVTLAGSLNSATLSYWWNMHSTDDEFTAYDSLTVTVRDRQGGLLQELERVNNTNLRDTWTQSSFDLSPYVGEVVRVQFRSLGNAQYVTSFFLDDISLTVCQTPVVVYLPLVWQSWQ